MGTGYSAFVNTFVLGYSSSEDKKAKWEKTVAIFKGQDSPESIQDMGLPILNTTHDESTNTTFFEVDLSREREVKSILGVHNLRTFPLLIVCVNNKENKAQKVNYELKQTVAAKYLHLKLL